MMRGVAGFATENNLSGAIRNPTGKFAGWTAMVLIATGAMYARTANYGFTNWDEPTVLLDRERVRSLSNLSAIWTEPHMMDYFPITETSYALEYAMGGYNPRVYHATNVILHLLCTWAVCWLAYTMGLGAMGSAVAGVVFGLHPMHVETVAWVADRKDLFACLFSLMSILFFMSHHRRHSKWNYALAVSFGLLAMLSKPSAASLGACVVVFQVVALRAGILQGVRRSAPLLIAGLALSALVFQMHAAGGNIQLESYTDPGQSVLLSVYGFAFHLWKFILPHPLIPLYDVGKLEWDDGEVWGGLGLMIGSIAVIWAFRRKNMVLLAMGWYVVGIAPVLRFVQVGSMVVADRYMYFPSVGLCLLLGWAVAYRQNVRDADAGPRSLIWVGKGSAAIVVVLFSWLTHAQIGHWSNSEALWRHTIAIQPNGEAYTNLGTALSDQKRYEEAVQAFRKAIEWESEDADWYTNLGNALMHMERDEEAIVEYQKAIRLSPGHYKARVNLCQALVHEKRYAQALAVATRGLHHSPDQPAMMNMTAWMFATCPEKGLRNGVEAVRLARKASELQSHSDAYTLDTLAAGMAEVGDFQGAIEQARRAIQVAETNGQSSLIPEIRERLALYASGQAYRIAE